MSETQKHTTRNGFITIIGTYIIWGLLPLYFVVMAPAGSIEIVVARVVFSLIFCALLLPILRATADFRRALKDRRIMLDGSGPGVLLRHLRPAQGTRRPRCQPYYFAVSRDFYPGASGHSSVACAERAGADDSLQ